MRIAFLYREGRARRLKKVGVGAAASEFFYGAIELGNRGHTVELFDVGNEDRPGGAQRALNWLGACGVLPARVDGGRLLQVWDLLPRLRGFDVVIGTNPGIAFSLALARRAGMLRAPVVAIQVGLLNDPPTRWQRALNGYLLRRMWSQIYGDAELEELRRLYRLPAQRVVVNQFGVDTRFWTPGDGDDEGYVISVGNDGRRDYELLMEAAGKITSQVVVVTKRRIKAEIPPNVKVRAGSWHGEEISEPELRELYRRARCVVIPLVESLQPSGQSVCLQAMACGRPVVLTRTRGLWSATMMRDGENVVFVSPGDAAGLAAAVEQLLADRDRRSRLGAAARKTVCAEADVGRFAERMEQVCAVALAAGA